LEAFNLVKIELAGAWFDLSTNALNKLFRRLCRAGLILHVGNGYYMLTRRAVRLLGIPPRRVSAPSLPGFVQATGVVGSCIAAELEKISAADFANNFPELCPRRGAQVGYYAFTPSDGLAWILVDHGAKPKSLVRKVEKVVSKRLMIPAFRVRILAGGFFSIVLAVPSIEKQVAVEAILKENPPSRHVRVQLVVVPELQNLLLGKGPK
jgi:hypothetical protein